MKSPSWLAQFDRPMSLPYAGGVAGEGGVDRSKPSFPPAGPGPCNVLSAVTARSQLVGLEGSATSQQTVCDLLPPARRSLSNPSRLARSVGI